MAIKSIRGKIRCVMAQRSIFHRERFSEEDNAMRLFTSKYRVCVSKVTIKSDLSQVISVGRKNIK